jgi:hypothetical protein
VGAVGEALYAADERQEERMEAWRMAKLAAEEATLFDADGDADDEEEEEEEDCNNEEEEFHHSLLRSRKHRGGHNVEARPFRPKKN